MDIQEKMYELYGYGSETNWRKVKGYLTTQEVGDLIGKSPDTVVRWMKSGKLPPPVPTKGWLCWQREVILEWLGKRMR